MSQGKEVAWVSVESCEDVAVQVGGINKQVCGGTPRERGLGQLGEGWDTRL